MKYLIYSVLFLFLGLSFTACSDDEDEFGLDTSPNTFVATLEGENWTAEKQEAILFDNYLMVYAEASDKSLIALKVDLYKHEPIGRPYIFNNNSTHFAAYDNTSRADTLLYWTKNNYDDDAQSGDVELTQLDTARKLVSGTFKCRVFNNLVNSNNPALADYLYFSQGAFTDIPIVDVLTINLTGEIQIPIDTIVVVEPNPGTWAQTSNFPGLKRQEAVAFTYNDQGFVGLGTRYPDMFGDFYKYTPSSDTWTQLSDFAGVPRRSAIAFVLGDYAYAGLGYGNDGGWNSLNDIWKYDIINDTWSPLNDFPSSGNYEGASCFVVNSKAYVVLEDLSVYEYDAVNDSWIQKADFVGTSRKDAVSFVIGSKAYYGTGYDDGADERLNDFWEYNPSNDTWTQKANLPDVGRNNASGFSIENSGFIGMGNDFMNTYDEIFKYTPATDTWVQAGTHPLGTGNGLACFVIGNTAYMGTGFVSSQYQTSFYKFEDQ